MSLGRFPTEMPTAEILTVINFLRGKAKNKKEAAEAAWWAGGYAVNQVLPNDLVVMTSVPEGYDLAAQLEALTSMHTDEFQAAIDWKTLALALWAQAKQWIDDFLKGV